MTPIDILASVVIFAVAYVIAIFLIAFLSGVIVHTKVETKETALKLYSTSVKLGGVIAAILFIMWRYK